MERCYSIALLIFIICSCLIFKIAHQGVWLHSSPGPYFVEGLNPAIAEQNILLGHKININSASKGDLEVLPGIGPKLAARIVASRLSAGGFSSVGDIMNVKGIGRAKFTKIRHFIDIK